MMREVEPVAELDERFSESGASATAWTEVRRLLEQSELFWISTVRRDGRPHVTPLPAVWRDGALHFCTGAGEQKGMNLASNPSCALTTGTNTWNLGLDVVVEGDARRVEDEARLLDLARAWESKYRGDWHFEVEHGAFQGEGGEALVFAVAPTKILAFAKRPFAQTRFRLVSSAS
jgi:nitroimidazol reductase NimA-like FMN-containing flavoprotein (pyridoxamine 5'-phosphate oxidase superfamily)